LYEAINRLNRFFQRVRPHNVCGHGQRRQAILYDDNADATRAT